MVWVFVGPRSQSKGPGGEGSHTCSWLRALTSASWKTLSLLGVSSFKSAFLSLDLSPADTATVSSKFFRPQAVLRPTQILILEHGQVPFPGFYPRSSIVHFALMPHLKGTALGQLDAVNQESKGSGFQSWLNHLLVV